VARAHFITYLIDTAGNVIGGATVTVYERDTETPLSQTLYAEDDVDGNDTKTNPFSAEDDGKIEFWLDTPDVVDIKIQKLGFEDRTIRGTVHQLAANDLVLKENGTPMTQRAAVNFSSEFDLTDDPGNDETEVAISSVAASKVPITDAGGNYAATNVETALAEMHDTFEDHSARHENGGADEISLTGLDGAPTELTNHLNDATDAHDASAISIADVAGDFTATDVEGALAELQSDNEAHVAAGDPHPGYRLESADHTHQSAGAQAGKLDHGLALNGLTDDDHTIYLKEKASGGLASEVPEHNHSAAAEGGLLDGSSLGHCLLRATTTITSDPIRWETGVAEEVADTHGFHDMTTNSERITIPSSMDGRTVRLTASIAHDPFTAAGFMEINLEDDTGLVLARCALDTVQNELNEYQVQFSTPVITVATGDWFHLNAITGTENRFLGHATNYLTWFELIEVR
jgi:hypothetical protein